MAEPFLFPVKLARSEHFWGTWPVADCPPRREEVERKWMRQRMSPTVTRPVWSEQAAHLID